MNAEHLHLLAAELRQWPFEQFNFAVWVGDDWQGKPDFSCGTTACALGVATTMPIFQALGLKLVKSRYGAGYVIVEGREPTHLYSGGEISLIDTSLHSAMTIFDLTREEANYLFVPRDQLLRAGDGGAEFFGKGPVRADVVDGNAAIHLGAGGVAGDFLQLLDGVEGEQRHAMRMGGGDGGGFFDRVTELMDSRARRQ